jgi:acyl-coenzyme A synthetase/AMP-(fatty) acid ligase
MDGSLAQRIGEVLAGEGQALQFEAAWRGWPALNAIARAVRAAVAPVARDLAVAHVSRNRPSGAATLLGLLAERRCVLQISAIQPAATLAAEIERLAPAAVIADRDDWAPAVVEAARGVGALGVVFDGEAVSIHPELTAPGAGPHHPAPEGVGLLMPTSGTTGPPKRVPVTFKQLESYRADRDAAPGAAKAGQPRVIIIASPLFTVTGLRPFLAFATRPLRLVLMEKVDVKVWAGLVAEHRPREGGLPPAAMKMLLDSDAPRDALSCLSSWNTGSAPVDPDIAERFEAEFGVLVLVSYGATEFGGAVAGMTLADRQKWGTAKRGSSGRAMPGNRLRVVDPETGAERAAGMSGLLEVDAVRTGGGWTRTNDIARIDADGFLYIEGRADDVIIRGGFKVPLLEVEATLAKHPDIAQVAVLAEDDARLGQVPVAAVVARAGAGGLTGEAVGEWAREQMAPYKRPVRIAVLAALPMTASMKVNRPELRRLLAEVFANDSDG